MNPDILDDDYQMKNIMDDVYDQALEKLSLLERAAIFHHFETFRDLWKKEETEKFYETME